MHICPDEIWLFMMALPFIGSAFHWLRHKLRKQPKCSESDIEGSCSLVECENSKRRSIIFDPLDPG